MYAYNANEVRAAMPVDEQIRTLLDAFDFECCRQLMVVLGWRWGMSEDPPSVMQLRQDAEKSLRYVATLDPDETFVMSMSGGIVASRMHGALDLGFGFSARKTRFVCLRDLWCDRPRPWGEWIPDWTI